MNSKTNYEEDFNEYDSTKEKDQKKPKKRYLENIKEEDNEWGAPPNKRKGPRNQILGPN